MNYQSIYHEYNTPNGEQDGETFIDFTLYSPYSQMKKAQKLAYKGSPFLLKKRWGCIIDDHAAACTCPGSPCSFSSSQEAWEILITDSDSKAKAIRIVIDMMDKFVEAVKEAKKVVCEK